MAIVCACLTTLRPLFNGIDLGFLSSLRWTSRRTASASSANSKGRWSDPTIDPESDRKKEEERMRSLPGRRKSDTELLGFKQVVNTGTRGGTAFMERAESSKRGNPWQEDGMSTSARAKSEESFV